MYLTQRPVKVLYMFPTDRPVNGAYLAAVRHAIADVQQWFKQHLIGRTFHIASVEIFPLQHGADYYKVDSWRLIQAEVQPSSSFVYVVYADVVRECHAPPAQRLGAAIPGLTILPRQDMDGLCGLPYFDECGRQYHYPPSRYIGGLAHELGHTFGLSHPADDQAALMWTGYVNYPNTYLRSVEKESLLNHPAFDTWHPVNFSNQHQWRFDAHPDGKFTMFDVTNNQMIDYTGMEGCEWLLRVVDGQLKFFEKKVVDQ